MDDMVKDAVTNGSSVVEIGWLYDYELAYGKWYRSKDKKGGIYPFGSNMMNKKWTLEEEFTNHLLWVQQVKVIWNYFSQLHSNAFQAGLSNIEVNFEHEPEETETEPLRMEHFYLPLGMWFLGIIVSLFILLTEIVIHRRRKSKSDVEDTEDTVDTP